MAGELFKSITNSTRLIRDVDFCHHNSILVQVGVSGGKGKKFFQESGVIACVEKMR